jgi:predicted ATPase
VQPLTDDDTGPVDALAEATTGIPTLLIVDNCEHLIDDVADFADAVVAECPTVTILATSRESLAIGGEHLWRIPNLSDDAIELFIERASSAGADPTDLAEQVELVNRICRSLDDIPLAIELAAAQCGSLPLAELATRLDDRFAILGGGRRRGRSRQRQQTLQAMMDWSYSLLSEDEKTLLAKLAVFSGTFSVTGVEAVASPAQTPTRARLQSLVEKSLVTPPTNTGRYRLLETVRLYALGRLAEADALRQTRDRHLDWLNATIGADAYFAAGRADDQHLNAARERLCFAEIENGIAAMEWADENGRADELFSLIVGLDPVWSAVGPYARTGLDWLRRVPVPPTSEPTDRATWMAVAGQIHMNLGDIAKAFEYFLDGAELVEELRHGDPARFSFWMSNLMFRSILHATAGNFDAAFADADLLAELAENAGSHRPWIQSGSWMARAMAYAHLGDPRRLAAARQALSTIDGHSLWGEINAHALVADALAEQAKYEQALEHARVCLDAAMVNEAMRALAVVAATHAHAALGRFDEALQIIELDTGPMLEGQRRHMANALLTGLGAIFVGLGDRDRAEQLLAIALEVTDDAFDMIRRRRIINILGSEEDVDQLPEPRAEDLELNQVTRLIEESVAYARTLLGPTER